MLIHGDCCGCTSPRWLSWSCISVVIAFHGDCSGRFISIVIAVVVLASGPFDLLPFSTMLLWSFYKGMSASVLPLPVHNCAGYCCCVVTFNALKTCSTRTGYNLTLSIVKRAISTHFCIICFFIRVLVFTTTGRIEVDSRCYAHDNKEEDWIAMAPLNLCSAGWVNSLSTGWMVP